MALIVPVALIPPAAATQPTIRATNKSLPVVSMCLGVGQGGGLSYSNVTSLKPSTIIVACPAGGDDNPTGNSADTYLSDITWKKWNNKTAVGSGTLNIPVRKCTYTSPTDGSPSEVQSMCASSGDVGNITVVESKPTTPTLC